MQPPVATPAGLPPLPAAAAAIMAAAVAPPVAKQHQSPAAAAAAARDPRLAKCGFAKLLGDNGLEYFIQKYEVVMGRKSKTPVDVVLGDSPVLSRHHARILFNFVAKQWELLVEGKNGVTVNGTLVTPASGPFVLQSQDLLQAGDHNFYFLLPKVTRKRAPNKPKPAPGEGQGLAAAAAAAAAAAGDKQEPPQQQQQQAGQQSPMLGQPAAKQQQQQAGQQSPMLPGLATPGASALLPPLPGSTPGAAAAAGSTPSSAAAAAAPVGGLRSYSGPLLPGMSPMQGPGLSGSLGRSGSDGEGLLIQQPQFGAEGGSGGFGEGSGLLYGSGLLPAGVSGEFDQDEEGMDMP